MTKKQKAELITEKLFKEYPDAECSLIYSKDYELLIAGRLSAQCTDKRVNIVTKELFSKYKSLEDFANANLEDIEKIVMPCGLYKTKSKNIILMCQQIINNFDSKIPSSVEELTTLSGIGRKTANLIIGDIFGKPAIVTDTHCIRICGRLGLTINNEPVKVEADLKKIIPPDKSAGFCHRIVIHGREVCTARKTKCEICCLNDVCKTYDSNCKKHEKLIDIKD